MKIRPDAAELFQADKDVTKRIVIFHNFANALKNPTFCPPSVIVGFVRISEQTAIISLYSMKWVKYN